MEKKKIILFKLLVKKCVNVEKDGEYLAIQMDGLGLVHCESCECGCLWVNVFAY